ncbi:high-potential iron-sulfur protein [Uliginosibacterium sp. H3]|uniref:High-potential iron-sulfur protein n=1 Tax=Uliginosibacterium silvisoli TaxID=3114758 RepID=A0ABU6K0D4_9RHOO|nr:high-potential iron-sulfur protein [Uliginosibacterium sp. H3]
MINRRRFITVVPIVAAGAMLAGKAVAQEKVTEADGTAKALGYKEDASKVDATKYASYKAGNTCANCVQYTGKAGAVSGPCAAFGGKAVAARGWCMAWVKKT